MPDRTRDIQDAITTVVAPGEELTLAELNERLFRSYPTLQEDPRWIGVALSTMLSDGRLLGNMARGFTAGYAIRRPADA